MGRYSRQFQATVVITLIAYAILSYVLLAGRDHEALGEETRLVVSTLPHLIAAINTTTIVTLQLGYRAIKRQQISSHKRFMLASFVLISLFLVFYISRVVLGGVEVYKGPEVIRNFVYLPILAVHLALSIISVPLVLYNVLTGVTLDVNDIGNTKHPVTGRIAYLMWTLSLALGVVVYLFLRLT
ncbi:MAG: DUF420 domain-containing protein [Aigarchaeota archaeon]|nr:DUF420 domain-containing protein [Aigarchaeota archaeon]MDW8092860.1 DUF420 domain-containing protein [Nitrososphaerota archaeon]